MSSTPGEPSARPPRPVRLAALTLLVHGILTTLGGLVGVGYSVWAAYELRESAFQVFGYVGIAFFVLVIVTGIGGIRSSRGLPRRGIRSYIGGMLVELPSPCTRPNTSTPRFRNRTGRPS